MRKTAAAIILSAACAALLVACAGAPAENDVTAPEASAPAGEAAAPETSGVPEAPSGSGELVAAPTPIDPLPCPCEKGEIYVFHNPGEHQVPMCLKTDSKLLGKHIQHGDQVCCRYGDSLPCAPQVAGG